MPMPAKLVREGVRDMVRICDGRMSGTAYGTVVLHVSPEGAAATAAYDRLIAAGELKPTDKVVLFNTGAGLKYTDMTAEAMHLRRPGTLPKSLPVGGIITPV